MKIRNVWATARDIAATGQVVEPDGTVEVDRDLGAVLCEQPDVWQEVKGRKAVKSESEDS